MIRSIEYQDDGQAHLDIKSGRHLYWRVGLVQRAGDNPETTWRRMFEARLTSTPEIGSAP